MAFMSESVHVTVTEKRMLRRAAMYVDIDCTMLTWIAT
jgi:hypothetical protein